LIAAAQVANFVGGIMEGKDKKGDYMNNAIDIEVWGKYCGRCLAWIAANERRASS
jgi:hypothetical protein